MFFNMLKLSSTYLFFVVAFITFAASQNTTESLGKLSRKPEPQVYPVLGTDVTIAFRKFLTPIKDTPCETLLLDANSQVNSVMNAQGHGATVEGGIYIFEKFGLQVNFQARDKDSHALYYQDVADALRGLRVFFSQKLQRAWEAEYEILVKGKQGLTLIAGGGIFEQEEGFEVEAVS